MKLESLSIKGVLRFNDLLTVDLRELPPGLIVFVGENGEGKSTALETPLATLHRQFPSRAHKGLVDYAHDRDSYIETVFALEGQGLYRARVNLDAVTRGTEAVLVHVAADGTQTLLNDGKVTTYDPAVARVFPPKAVLLASAFAAQNRNGSFITADRKDRRALFGQFLGLEHLEQMAQTARTAAGLVDGARGRLQAAREVFARDSGPEQDVRLDADLQVLELDAWTTGVRREELAASIADVEARLATVQDPLAACAVASQRVRSLEGELTTAQAELRRVEGSGKTAEQALADERRRLEGKHRQAILELDVRFQRGAHTLRAELDRLDTGLAATFRDIDERIANNQRLVADADAIRAAVVRLAEVETSIATARADEQEWRGTKAKHEAAERELGQAIAIVRLAQNDLRRAEQDERLLTTVPCEGKGQYSGCQFLTQAKAAQYGLPALREKVAKLAGLEARQRDEVVNVAAADHQLATIGQTIRDLDADKARLAAKAKLEPAVAAAETRIEELQQKRGDAQRAADQARPEIYARSAAREQDLLADKARAEADLASSTEAAEARAADHARTCEARIRELGIQILELKLRLDAARADLTAAEQGNQQAQQLQGELAGLRRQWDETTAALATVAAGRETVRRQREVLATRRAELVDVETRLAALGTELLEWQLLAKALARDGLPTLEMDAAGPTVSSLTNDILAACGWSRWSVELVTQEARVSGKGGMKETFEVKVWDGERGGDARDIGDLSGGEQVIVDECLKNALAVYVNTRSQTPIRTCWRDETTSALGRENAGRYPTLLRKVHELGGYHHTIVITHNPDVAAMADAQVRFADGKAEVVLPPYQDAA